MKARRWIFWVLLAALFAYEGYALMTPEAGDTISEITWAVSMQAPVIGFFFGVLAGHFFWQRGGKA